MRSTTVFATATRSEPITAKSPSTMPSTSPIWQTPAIVTAARLATVTPPWRQLPAAAVIAIDVVLEAAVRVVRGEGREGLDARPGRDHRGPQSLVPGLSGCDLGDAEAVGVVRQQDHVAAPGSADSGEDLAGRRPPTRSAAHDGGSGSLEELAEPVTRHHGHDTASLGGQRGRPGESGVAEVRHADAVRTAGLDAGLDGRPDVVDVDVDVPRRLAADDDQRVAEVGQRGPQLGDRLLGCVEEVHDLVGRPAASAPRSAAPAPRRLAAASRWPRSSTGCWPARQRPRR